MAYYAYGGTVLPDVGSCKTHTVIYYRYGKYYYSYVPYTHYSFAGYVDDYETKGELYVRPGCNSARYVLNGSTWERSGSNYPYLSGFWPLDCMVWSNKDIYYNGEVIFEGSEPQNACDPPTITKYGIGNKSTLTLEGVPKMIFGKTSYVYMYCNSQVSDGGKITTEWYVDGVLKKTGSSSTGKAYSTLRFTADTVGEHLIYAVVTNSKNGYVSNSVTCATITITVSDEVIENPAYATPDGMTTNVPDGYVDEGFDEDISVEPSTEDTTANEPIYGTVGDDDWENSDIEFEDITDSNDGNISDDITQNLTVSDGIAALSLLLGRHIGAVILNQLNGR